MSFNHNPAIMVVIRSSLVILLMIIENCFCLPSYQSTSVNITKRQAGECWSNIDCGEHAWCNAENRCQSVCTGRMDCNTWSRDGYCAGERHISVCRAHSDMGNDIIFELTSGTKSEGNFCDHTYQCAPGLYCHINNRCVNPCKKIVRCTTDGPDNPGFAVLKSNEEYPESNQFSCVVKDYILSCE